jgi:hypothetical protein
MLRSFISRLFRPVRIWDRLVSAANTPTTRRFRPEMESLTSRDPASSLAFINEFHYDNAGSDQGEFIELAGTAGTDLSGWSIALYDGATGSTYFTMVLGGVISNQQNGYGAVAYFFPPEMFQNGSPDGMALVDNTGHVVQFLSYEGSFTALSGPAAGMTSTNVGASESGADAPGSSVQLTGTGSQPGDFTWLAPGPATPGVLNPGQFITAPPPAPVVGTGTGLLGQYFNGQNLTDEKVSRIDSTVNFTWGANAPAGGVSADNFSVRWTGLVQATYSGDFTFYTQSDDGVRLWVNGQLLIDQWNDHTSTEHPATMPITLVAGQLYDIKMEYYENTVDAVAQMSWSSPLQAKQIIPATQLYAQRFDLDVNANGSLDDVVNGVPIDGVNNYLPGYEGDVNKLWTGLSARSGQCTGGQQMRLMVDGIGTQLAGVRKIEFVITSTSSYEGYASNSSGSGSEPLLASQDYSFDLYANKASATITRTSTVGQDGGEMDATKTWVNFYCKDFGGAATVEARVFVQDGAGEKLARTITIKVPRDDDNDGLADKWEVEMAAQRSNQYGLPEYSAATALGLWNLLDDDNELPDPDGVGPGRDRLVDDKESGDAHTVLEEYRGYILDGGGFDGAGANGIFAGHIRLDPSRKEMLVEVDRTATLNHVPGGDLSGIIQGASKIFSQADRGAGIFMYYLFDEVSLAAPLPSDRQPTDPEFEGALSNSRDTAAARANQSIDLASDFFHVLFIDAWHETTGAITNDKQGTLRSRGTIFATSTTDNFYSDPLAPWVTSETIQAEAFMCVLAHELTHLLIKPVEQAGVWNTDEHRVFPGSTADLMYEPSTQANRQLATVKFTELTQQEIWMKSNGTFV